MAITDAARRHHEELFPGHVSTLATTDPELVEYFDNFAFDEVLQHGTLDVRTRFIVQLAALVAGQALAEYRAMLGAALTVGLTPVEVKEIVYQAVPYVGMGTAYDFLHATNEVLTDAGVELPLPGQSTTTPETRLEKGRFVQGEVVGHAGVDAMYANAPADLAHIQRYLSGNCFGDHLTRTGVDLATRELITFSFLISLGGCDPQVKGHVRGNLTAAMFVGDVWYDVIAAGEAPSVLRVNLVRFAPGAHTACTGTRTGRRCTSPTAWVSWAPGRHRDRHEARRHGPDPPGEWHWHGAAPEHFMAHLARWEGLAADQAGPETEWANLSENEYPGTGTS